MNGIIQTLDVSHVIHYLYFGDTDDVMKIQKTHPDSQLLPLNNHTRVYDMSTSPHSYTSHYHIDIVPTRYYKGALGST